MRLLIYVVPVALAIYALFDLYRSEPTERAEVQPLVWVLVIVILPVIGPIAWIFVSTTRRAEARAAGSPTPTAPGRSPLRSPRRTGPIAPDDDPDFLRHLDQQWHDRGNDAGGSGPDAPTS